MRTVGAQPCSQKLAKREKKRLVLLKKGSKNKTALVKTSSTPSGVTCELVESEEETEEHIATSQVVPKKEIEIKKTYKFVNHPTQPDIYVKVRDLEGEAEEAKEKMKQLAKEPRRPRRRS